MDTTYKTLVDAANAFRWTVIKAIMNAIAEMVYMGREVKADFSGFQVDAAKPTGLGFSIRDLWYMFEEFSWRHLVWASMAAKAAAEATRLNGELSMFVVKNHNYGQKKEKERLASIARRASIIAREHEAFAMACTVICGELYKEILRRAIVQEKAMPKPVAKPVALITPEIVKPIVMKRRPKGLKKTAQCRGEITLSGFDALKEYQENTAMFSETYHGE